MYFAGSIGKSSKIVFYVETFCFFIENILFLREKQKRININLMSRIFSTQQSISEKNRIIACVIENNVITLHPNYLKRKSP